MATDDQQNKNAIIQSYELFKRFLRCNSGSKFNLLVIIFVKQSDISGGSICR